MRRFVAFIFLFTFFAQTFSNACIVAGYFINATPFAKNCENKSRPAMHCNGKCQMMKKLKQENNKDAQNPGRRSENKTEVLSSCSFFPELQFGYNFPPASYSELIVSLSSHPSPDFFHPPQQAGFTA